MSIDVNGEVPMDAPLDPLARQRMLVEVLEEDKRTLIEELIKERRTQTALRAMIAKNTQEHPQGQTARLIARYYVHRLDKTKAWKFGEKRQKAVMARLKEDYEPLYICRAIDGIAIGYNTNRDTGVVYDDLELVCRDEVNLDRFYQLAEKNDAKSLIGPEWEAEFGGLNANDESKLAPRKTDLTRPPVEPTLDGGAE